MSNVEPLVFLMSNSQHLIQLVLSTSFVVPGSWGWKMVDAREWCWRTFGEERAGNIFHEAEEGRLDFFEGAWCMRWYEPKATWLFWFSSRSQLAQFILSWS